MESAKERERGECPHVNKIFVLLALSSGYTILKT